MSGAESTMETSKNAIICHSCANDVHEEYVSCQGFCNAVFHLECCGVSPELMKEIATHRQIFWLCKSCSNLMGDLRHRRSVQCAFEAGQELSLSHHNRIVEQLKSEILSELKTELSSNFAKLISSNSLTPRSNNRVPDGQRFPGGRRIFGNNPAPAPVPNLGLSRGEDGTNERIVADSESPEFWLYLSRVSRRVTEEQITKLAGECLGASEFKVVKLVAKDWDVNRMKFISFKIGMRADLKDKALSTATWPKGLLIREFVERSGEIFWEPAITAGTGNGNLQIQQHSAAPPKTTPQPVTTPRNPASNSPMSTGSSTQEQQLD